MSGSVKGTLIPIVRETRYTIYMLRVQAARVTLGTLSLPILFVLPLVRKRRKDILYQARAKFQTEH